MKKGSLVAAKTGEGSLVKEARLEIGLSYWKLKLVLLLCSAMYGLSALIGVIYWRIVFVQWANPVTLTWRTMVVLTGVTHLLVLWLMNRYGYHCICDWGTGGYLLVAVIIMSVALWPVDVILLIKRWATLRWRNWALMGAYAAMCGAAWIRLTTEMRRDLKRWLEHNIACGSTEGFRRYVEKCESGE